MAVLMIPLIPTSIGKCGIGIMQNGFSCLMAVSLLNMNMKIPDCQVEKKIEAKNGKPQRESAKIEPETK